MRSPEYFRKGFTEWKKISNYVFLWPFVIPGFFLVINVPIFSLRFNWSNKFSATTSRKSFDAGICELFQFLKAPFSDKTMSVKIVMKKVWLGKPLCACWRMDGKLDSFFPFVTLVFWAQARIRSCRTLREKQTAAKVLIGCWARAFSPSFRSSHFCMGQ